MRNALLLLSIILLNSCGFAVQLQNKADEKELLNPGASDAPLTGFYAHYQYNFLDRYQIKHQWLRESNCQYSKIEIQKYESKDRFYKDRFFKVYDIYEEGNSTKQRGAHSAWNFDRFVRAEYTWKRSNGDIEKEKGYEPICFESWWNTSHSIALFLRKQPLEEMKAGFSLWYPEGIWSTKVLNNLTWYVQETPENNFRRRPLNGVAGPFKLWMTPIVGSGYTLAIMLGASKESLEYPDTHLRMQAMLEHLIESVKIEPIQASPIGIGPSHKITHISPENHTETAINSSLPKATSHVSRQCRSKQECPILEEESKSPPIASSIQRSDSMPYAPIKDFPERSIQLQQEMQRESNRQMDKLLHDTTPNTRK